MPFQKIEPKVRIGSEILTQMLIFEILVRNGKTYIGIIVPPLPGLIAIGLPVEMQQHSHRMFGDQMGYIWIVLPDASVEIIRFYRIMLLLREGSRRKHQKENQNFSHEGRVRLLFANRRAVQNNFGSNFSSFLQHFCDRTIFLQGKIYCSNSLVLRNISID